AGLVGLLSCRGCVGGGDPDSNELGQCWGAPRKSTRAFVLQRNSDSRDGARYCMNQPWLTTSDCPVNALLSKPAKNTAVSATSATVVNSPSTVSLSITFLITSASGMPSSLACSGICLSPSGVWT